MADSSLEDWLRAMDDQIQREEEELQQLQGSLNDSFSPMFIPKVSLPTPAVPARPDEEHVESDLGDSQEPTTVATRLKALKDSKKAEFELRSRAAVPVEDRLLQQAFAYQRNKEVMKKQLQEQEAESSKPLGIDKKSELIVQRLGGRDGPVEERLIKGGQRIGQEKKESLLREEVEARKNAKPVISSLAAKLERNEDVSERLLQFQKVYQENLLHLKEKMEEQLSFKPQINKRDDQRTEIPSGRKSPLSVPEQPSFKPALSKKSMQIAARLGKARERLTTSKSKEILTEEPSFRPVINKRSEMLDNRSRGSKGSRWAALYDQAKESREKPKADLTAKSEEDKECTFKPKILTEATNGDVVSRLLEWSRVKETKVQLAKETHADKDLTECTFMPAVLSTQLHEMKPVDSPDPSFSKGVDKFLERHRLARRRKEEQEERLHVRSKSDISRQQGKTPNVDNSAVVEVEEPSNIDFVEAVRALHIELQAL